jgi:hypothetical protein
MLIIKKIVDGIMRKKILKIFLIVFLSGGFIQNQTYDQANMAQASVVSKITVGSLISETKDAVEELINTAFDRLDLSVLSGAMEMRATVNQASIIFNDSLDKSVEEFDGQQQRVIVDLQNLQTMIDKDINGVINNIKNGSLDILSEIRVLISNNPGSLIITSKPAVEGDTELFFTISGTAISKADLENFQVFSEKIQPRIIKRDDRVMEFAISIPENDAADFTQGALEVPISFLIDDTPWWKFWSSEKREFVASGIVLPKIIGEVSAIFTGQINAIEKKSRKLSFTSEKVQSKLRWRGIRKGKRKDVWFARARNGWRIDTSTAKLKVKLNNDSCSGSRSKGSIIELDETIIRAKVTTSSDRKAGATCTTTSSISFTEWKPTKNPFSARHNDEIIHANKTVALALSNIEDIIKPALVRLSHIEIRSLFFSNEVKIIRVGDNSNGVNISYDAATQTAFVTMSYVR